MYTSLYDFLVKNGVVPSTAQAAVDRINKKFLLGLPPLTPSADQLVSAARRAVRFDGSNRGLRMFDVGDVPREEAVVLPGEDVMDEDEGEEYVATRPAPFRAGQLNYRGLNYRGLNDRGLNFRGEVMIGRVVSRPVVQMLAGVVAGGL